MLNSDDIETPASLNQLRRVLSEAQRPLVIWLGAGVSKWAGYPSWKELTRSVHKVFIKESSGYPVEEAKGLLRESRFPEVFQMCKLTDPRLYNRTLAENLQPRDPTVAYKNFIKKLQALRPLLLISSNVDLSLEQNITGLQVIERTNAELFVTNCLGRSESILKVHGSVSTVESMVFTTDDYESLLSDNSYCENIKTVFSISSILFLGYGLRDKYVLDLLSRERKAKPIFGAGPHFLVTSENESPNIPVHPIRYSVDRYSDHRGALTVLDYMAQTKSTTTNFKVEKANEQTSSSAFFITDFRPPGLHNTSQTAIVGREGSASNLITIGLGWVAEDEPTSASHALHDLAVGLTCFDLTCLPLEALDSAIGVLGQHLVKELLLSESLGFIHRQQQPVVLFGPDELIGSVGMIALRDKTGLHPLSADELIRKSISPIAGHESEFQDYVNVILKRTIVAPVQDSPRVPQATRNALLLPRVSKLLGFSQAVVSSQVPAWLRFPTLRLAHLVQVAEICQDLGIVATRLPFGGASLISAAFGITAANHFADEYASYVVSGSLTVRLDEILHKDPNLLYGILRFRSTQASLDLRKGIQDHLKSEGQSEFGPAIDGALRRSLPFSTVQAARQEMQNLLLSSSIRSTTPAVWTAPSYGDTDTKHWRNVSRNTLLNMLRDRRENTFSPCLCHSGDRVRDCCLVALR